VIELQCTANPEWYASVGVDLERLSVVLLFYLFLSLFVVLFGSVGVRFGWAYLHMCLLFFEKMALLAGSSFAVLTGGKGRFYGGLIRGGNRG
jgi:hypothetical protein